MLMIIIENLPELRQMEPIHFLDDTDLFQRNATFNFFTFSSMVIPTIHRLIFSFAMPRIGEELKAVYRNHRGLVGD